VSASVPTLIWRTWIGISAIVALLPLVSQWSTGEFGLRFSSILLGILAIAAIYYSVKVARGESKWRVVLIAAGFAVASIGSINIETFAVHARGGGWMSAFAAVWFAVSPVVVSRVLAAASQESDNEENPPRPVGPQG
jgi:hypothetical protein